METRNCQNCKTDFMIDADDFAFYDKMQVPPPTFCYPCRQQRRLAWRNDVNFYKGSCVFTGESVISMYPPESGIPVASTKAWHADSWDAIDYGIDYDFSRPFFQQFAELNNNVPKLALNNDDGIQSVNCKYTNDFAMGKNCYLVMKAWKLEDIAYSFYVINSRDLLDVHTSFGNDEGNYETVNTEYCYRCRFVYDSKACTDSAFLYDCRNCDNCFMCTGLRNKSYYFKNEFVGKEEYEKIVASYELHTHTGIERAKKEFKEIDLAHPRRALRMVNCEDCMGDLVYNSKNCKYCVMINDSENLKFGQSSDGVKDSYDTDAGGGSELAYECDIVGFCSRIVGSLWSWNCQDSAYLHHCYRCRDCFGCSGFKDKQYCILNKQYTKEEYFELLPKIKQHMADMAYIDAKGRSHVYGDYPPVELSYFPYNETAAESIFELTPEQIEAYGFSYRPKTQNITDSETVRAQDLPDSIDEVDDSILNEIIRSEHSDQKYRIIRQELDFYRKYRIPLPHESFFERHARRHKLATSYKFFNRTSDKSGIAITSSYPQDAAEKVWSIEEYKQEFE